MSSIIDIHFTRQQSCPVCGKLGYSLISLPAYPITEMYTEWGPGLMDQGFMDQSILFCRDCQHAYLEKILDVRFIYENYLTTSASSHGAISCLKAFRTFVERCMSLDGCKLMIDIGGNDSTFLGYFSERDEMELVNVDPNATGEGRFKLTQCFLEDIDLTEYKRTGKKVIVSSHTIEHLSEPSELISKIADALTDEDYCFLQFPALECLARDSRFDQICHQHVNYFSISSIAALMNRHGMHIFDFEYDSAHFGTLRVATRLGRASGSVQQNPRLSQESIVHQFEQFRKYYRQLNEILDPVFHQGNGFGAGLMVPTLAYYLPVVRSLKYIFDENSSKHGKRFINIPAQIVPPTALDPESPILITSISTNSAAREIFNKLVAREVKKIVMPTIIT